MVRLEAETSKYQTQLAAATKQLEEFRDGVGEAVQDLAAKFAELFTVDAIAEFVSGTVESAASLQKLSQQAGVSVEQLSAFGAVAAQAGVSQDDMASSLKKLNVAISDAAGNATSKAAFAFQALGISVTNSNGSLKSAGQLLPEIADAYSKLADGPNKVAINTDLLGRSAQALIPVLDQGSTALSDLEKAATDSGAALSGDLAEAAEALEKKFIALKQATVGSISTDVLEAALPVLNKFADGFTAISNSGSSSNAALDAFVVVLKAAGAIVLEIDTELKALGSAFDGVEAFAKRAAAGISDAFTALGTSGVSGAVSILSDASSQSLRILNKQQQDSEDIWKAGNAAITALVQSGGDATVNVSKEIAAGIKDNLSEVNKELGNLGGGGGVSPEALQQLDAAQKKVQEFADSIKEQAQAFGLTNGAAVQFKLSTGAVGTAVALAKKNLDDMTAGVLPFNAALHDSAAATLAAAAAAQKWSAQLAVKEDTKTIDDFTEKLQEQVLRYGESSVAATDYAARSGKLGQALTDLGAQGDKARGHIHDLALELTNDKDADALVNVNNQVQTLTGHLVEAAAAAFDFQNKLLVKNLAATGDTAGQQQLADLKALTTAQAEYNQLQQQATAIRTDEALKEADINAAVATGQTDTLAGQKQVSDSRTVELQQLTDVYNKMLLISDAGKLPGVVNGVQQFGAALKDLQVSALDPLAIKLKTDFENSASNAFASFVTGAQTAKQALQSFVADIESEFIKLATNKLLEQLLGGTTGTGFFSGLSSLFGGGKASGGPVSAGTSYTVGEHGAEAFVPNVNGSIIPNNKMWNGGSTVNQYFTIAAPAGTVSRQTQQQVAANASSGISRAARRNS